MGLEAVEIVMELEDRFGIALDDDMPQIVTVGDLHALVLARIAARQENPCVSRQVFYDLRDEVRRFLHRPELRLRPRARVVAVIPPRHRKAFWRQLARRFGELELHGLCRPPWVTRTIFHLTIGALFLSAFIAIRESSLVPVLLLITCLVPMILTYATRPWMIVPPANLETFADITRLEAGKVVATKVPPGDPVEVVNEILAETLNVPREKLLPMARLVEDLGMG